jgi:tetrahydromethanopterin S-methyltransferase subunit E
MDPTLIGALCGFGASITPEIFAVIASQQAHVHLMEDKRLQMDAAKENYTFQTNTNTIAASAKELELLLAHDVQLKSNPFIDALRASVRPVITYLFVLLFSVVKLALLFQWIYRDHTPFLTAVPMLWDTDTMSIFAAVLSFWFGSRAMEHYRGNINTHTASRKGRS